MLSSASTERRAPNFQEFRQAVERDVRYALYWQIDRLPSTRHAASVSLLERSAWESGPTTDQKAYRSGRTSSTDCDDNFMSINGKLP
jgi:hypothetical protein